MPDLKKKKKLPARVLRSAIEPLEPRLFLSITPTISGLTSVAAGTTYNLNLTHTGTAPVSWTINWGDGTSAAPDTVTYTGFMNSESHIFNYSATPYTITAAASDGKTSYNATAPLHLSVTQAAPDVLISGNTTTAQNSLYTLSLSAMSPTYNQGVGNVTSWTVKWGDGQSQTFTQNAQNSTFNPGWATVTHTYTVASGIYAITASAANNAGSFNAAPIAVTVNAGLPTTFSATQGQTFDAGNLDGTGSVTVPSGASITAGRVRQSSLTINGSLTIDPGAGLDDPSHVSLVSSLTLAKNSSGAFLGSLNLTDNTLIIEATPSTQQSVFQMVVQALASGRNNGLWNGNGINSSNAATDPSHGLGAIMNNNGSGTPLYTTFDGQTVDADAIIISYALYGDVNLDNVVNASDFSLFSTHFGLAVTGGWAQGDFNYDGFVNATDSNLFGVNWGKTNLISTATNTATPPQFVASFLSNPANPSSDFTATINWGDGSAPTPGAIVADGNGTFHVIVSHSYSSAGTFTALASVTELDNNATWAISSSASVAAFSAGAGTTVFAPALPDLPYSVPSSNPLLPAGMNVFAPPVTSSTTPPTGAPAFATADPTGLPAGSFSVTGTNFTAPGNPNPNDDTRFLVFGQNTNSNGTLTDAQIQDINPNGASLTISSSEPSNSMFIVWAINNAGSGGTETAGIPIAINRTQAQWVGTPGETLATNSSSPTLAGYLGQTLSIFGQNLSNGAAAPQSWVYLQPTAGGQGTWAVVSAANPYKVDFIVPKTLTVGSTYQIWINNGLGGKYSWSQAPTNFTVAAAAAPVWAAGAQYIINVKSYGAVGDGQTNDLSFIRNAINALQPGDTLYFPAGTYVVTYGSGDQPLNIPQFTTNVRIMGDSASTSVIRFQGIVPNTGEPWEFGEVEPSQGSGPIVVPGNIEFDSMTFEYNGTSFPNNQGGSLLSFRLRSNLTFNHVTLISGPLQSIELLGSSQATIENSTIIGGTLYGGAGNNLFVNNDNLFLAYNSIAALDANNSFNVSFTNSTVRDYSDTATNPSGYGDGRLIYLAPSTATYDQYVAGNSTFALQNVNTGINAGEQILSEGPGRGDSYYGAVSSATSNSVTFNTTSAPTNFFAGLSVVVTAGTGLAQMRTEAGAPAYTFNSSTGAYTMTLSLSGTWTQRPDSTSTIEVIADIYNSVFYNNTLQDVTPTSLSALYSSSGFQLWEGGYNDVFDSNIVQNAKTGVYLISADVHNPNDFIQILNNQIQNSSGYGIIITPDFPNKSNGTADTDPNDVGVVVRNNTISGPPIGITLQANSSAQPTFTIIENNTVNAPISGNNGTNAAIVVSHDPNVLVDQNTIIAPATGTPAPAVRFTQAGSAAIVLQGNTYTNYPPASIYSGQSGLPSPTVASPYDVYFASAASGSTASLSIPLLNDGPSPLIWTVANPSASWILTQSSTAPIAGENTPALSVGASGTLSLSAVGLAPGMYFSSISISADGITKFIGIWFSVH